MTMHEAMFDDFFEKSLPREGFTIEENAREYVILIDQNDTSLNAESKQEPAAEIQPNNPQHDQQADHDRNIDDD